MIEGKNWSDVPTNGLMRKTQDISSGASPSALKYDCGRRTAVTVVCSGRN